MTGRLRLVKKRAVLAREPKVHSSTLSGPRQNSRPTWGCGVAQPGECEEEATKKTSKWLTGEVMLLE